MAGPVSPARRARAARVRRQGGTQQLAADAARVNVSTVQRWEKTPGFQDMLHSRGVLQAGPLKILADDSAALDDVDADESIMWVAGGWRVWDPPTRSLSVDRRYGVVLP
jgi:hypothetical protein